MKKERLDVLMVQRNLAESREKAKALIMSGIVYVNGQKEDKAGTSFEETVQIEVRGSTLKYVSRGGLKLEKAMSRFGVQLAGKVCMDVGASTGGFTDCMLQNGAVKVYAVDVGHGQLAWKLRNDDRVICMEKTNIRYVTPEDIGDRIEFASIDVSFISLTKVLGPVKQLLTDEGQVVCLIKPQFEAGREKVGKKGVVREKSVHLEVIEMVSDYARSIDVSFISLTKVLGPVKQLLTDNGQVVCLIKPQFEAGREKVGKKGVVREKSVHLEVIEMVSDYARSIGFGILGLEFSPIKGPEGNIEYLLYLQNYPQEEAGQEETGQEVAGQEEIKRPDYELSARAIVEQAHGCLD